tara:strand:+ start:459 stop:935 length:477 start_codon:yes stop_codon:yes gene_type:complete
MSQKDKTSKPTDTPSPRLLIQSQYIKDLSFENTRDGTALSPESRPEVNVKFAIGSNKIDSSHEVTLTINVEVKDKSSIVFILELVYAGRFLLEYFPKEAIMPTLRIECARLMFPFARRIIADITRDGGVPPLMLDPIDFVSMYNKHKKEKEKQTNQAK